MSRAAISNTFLVVAAKPNGGRSFSLRSARSRPALAESLRRDRLLLLKAYDLPRWMSPAAVAGSGERMLGLKDHAVLNEQLAQLLSRGVPLVEALEVVASTVPPASRSRIDRIREQVAAGSGFADACKKAGGFDAVTVAVYRAAERTGDLAGAGKQLAETARRTLAVVGRAGTLMLYPAIVMSISIIIASLMLAILVPRIGESLAESGIQLPGYTKLVVAVGGWMRDHALYLLLLLAAAIATAIFFHRQLGVLILTAARRTPMLRDVLLAQESARFFSVMAAMSRAGVPLADALTTANQAVNHPRLRAQMERLRTRLIEGGVLRLLIDEVESLPLATRRLLIAAERAGDMESAFSSLATDMTDLVERRSSRLLAVLEPALVIFMFLMIGSLLLAIVVPLLTLSSRVGN